MYRKGWNQFIPFIVTTISILLTDVLFGVLIGTASSLFFLLRGNFYNPFYMESIMSNRKKEIRLELSNEVSFLNKPAIKKILWGLSKNSKIIIDATFTTYVEQDIVEILHDFQNTFAQENGIEVIVLGLRESYNPKSQIKVVRSQTKLKKAFTTPQEILNHLREGNQNYVDGNLVSKRLRNKELMDFIKEAPLAVVINCIDMREPLNMLLNTGIGDLIPLRALGNIMSDDLIYSTEVACKNQGARLILLMGNSKNSFIREALECHLKGNDSYLKPLLGSALSSGVFSQEKLKNEKVNVLVDEITMWNLTESKSRIMSQNAYLSEQVSKGNLGLCSAFFNRKTGKIEFSSLFLKSISQSSDSI
jgi:carbonic anhydrase